MKDRGIRRSAGSSGLAVIYITYLSLQMALENLQYHSRHKGWSHLDFRSLNIADIKKYFRLALFQPGKYKKGNQRGDFRLPIIPQVGVVVNFLFLS